jgi:hypothetical protein
MLLQTAAVAATAAVAVAPASEASTAAATAAYGETFLYQSQTPPAGRVTQTQIQLQLQQITTLDKLMPALI